MEVSTKTAMDIEYAAEASPTVCFGSKPDERGHRPEGPHLGVKQTKSEAKQILPLEGWLSEVERSYQRRGPNRRS